MYVKPSPSPPLPLSICLVIWKLPDTKLLYNWVFRFVAKDGAMLKEKIFHCKLDFSALCKHRPKILTDVFWVNVTQSLGPSCCVIVQVKLRRSQFSAFLFYFISFPLCTLNKIICHHLILRCNAFFTLKCIRKDSDKVVKIALMREAAKRVTLGPDSLPSICFYSVLNAHSR